VTVESQELIAWGHACGPEGQDYQRGALSPFIGETRKNAWILTSGRQAGAKPKEHDSDVFEEWMTQLVMQLDEQNAQNEH